MTVGKRERHLGNTVPFCHEEVVSLAPPLGPISWAEHGCGRGPACSPKMNLFLLLMECFCTAVCLVGYLKFSVAVYQEWYIPLSHCFSSAHRLRVSIASAVNFNSDAQLQGSLAEQPAGLAVGPTFVAQTEGCKCVRRHGPKTKETKSYNCPLVPILSL